MIVVFIIFIFLLTALSWILVALRESVIAKANEANRIAQRNRNEKFAKAILELPEHQTNVTDRINAQIIVDEKRERERGNFIWARNRFVLGSALVAGFIIYGCTHQ